MKEESMKMQEKKEEVLRLPITEKQRRSFEEDNEDLCDFLRKTRAWRNAPSSNDKCRLR